MKLVASVLLLLTVACNAPSRGYLGSDVFEDVPAPRRAKYLDSDNQSFSYRGRSFRSGRFEYEYQGNDADVVRFYKETMTAPPYSWNLAEEDGTAAGSSRLVFTKGDDRCQVDIDRVPVPVEKPDNVTIVVRLNYRR